MPSRMETLTKINQFKDEKTIQLATTGKTGRELYEMEDSVRTTFTWSDPWGVSVPLDWISLYSTRPQCT